jgi:hypothetical protein
MSIITCTKNHKPTTCAYQLVKPTKKLAITSWLLITGDFMQETIEPFHTIKDAARILQIPYWKLQRAVKAELIPSYRLLNSKRYVKLCEIESVIQSHGNATANP